MDLHGFDLNLLVALDALLAERSVTNAGRRVHLSQSAMSGVLARLRHAFNDKLLVASRGGMTLTPLAESLIEPVRSILEEIYRTIIVNVPFDPATSRRVFTIAASDYAVTGTPDRCASPNRQRRPRCHGCHHPAARTNNGVRGSRARSRYCPEGLRASRPAARSALRGRVHRHRLERAFKRGRHASPGSVPPPSACRGQLLRRHAHQLRRAPGRTGWHRTPCTSGGAELPRAAGADRRNGSDRDVANAAGREAGGVTPDPPRSAADADAGAGGSHDVASPIGEGRRARVAPRRAARDSGGVIGYGTRTARCGAAQAATSSGIAISYFPKMSVIAAGSSSCGLSQPASKNFSQFFAQGRP